jgi:transcriptional regulator with XRE-family HTH domain
MPDELEEHTALGNRLREAREYVGLLQEDVASALGIPRTSLSALEAGKRKVSGVELRRFARLYRRPVGWLLGEETVELDGTAPLFRATAQLSDHDKEQVLRFAEFLAAAGRPSGADVAAGERRSTPRKRPRRTDG